MSKLSPSQLFYAAAVGAAALLFLLNIGLTRGVAAHREPGGAPRAVVVELFTSEGCSSCPPADALLKELSEQQSVPGVQIVALEEHVDYWNHLGWKDPYSANQFSQRQNDYAQVFGRDGVYTPQMVVDGQSEIVGSRSLAAKQTIEKAANQSKAEITLAVSTNASFYKPVLEVQIKSREGLSLHPETELWLAVTEKGLQTDVRAGENSGEMLKHAAVVRSLRKIGTLRDPNVYQRPIQLVIDPGWKKENLTAVVFLAEKRSLKIVGAATVPLNSSNTSN